MEGGLERKMNRGLLKQYFENWCSMTTEIVCSSNMRILQKKIDGLSAELDLNGTWTEDGLSDTYLVWIEYTKELLRGGFRARELKDEVFQCCIHMIT